MLKILRFLPLLGLLLAGCDDDENGPNPTLTVAVGEAVNLVQGQSGTTTITVTRGGGYDDEVDLTVTGLPTGVTAVLAPETIPAGTGIGTSTLTLTADATAVPGTQNFTVGAVATTRSDLTASATASVTVAEAAGFTLAVDPDTVTVEAGGTGTSTVTLTRTGGFAEGVNLTVDSLPTGVTASFDNAAPTGNTAVVTFTVDSTVTPDTTTVHVKGTGTPGAQTADIVLVITAAGSSAGFSIAVDPDTVTVAASGTGTSTVTLTRTGGFADAVNLVVDSLPAGVTASFDNAAPTGDTAVVTFTADSTVTADTTTVHLTGTGTPGSQTADIVLVTTGPAPAPPFSISLASDSLTIPNGASDTTRVTVNKTGTFAGPVNLTVDSLPTGVTAAFAPAATSDTSVLTITVDSTAVAGATTLRVRASATGFPDADTTLTLTVGTPAPADSFSLSANPDTLSATVSGTATDTITVVRTGAFAGTVTLTVDSLPAGVTAAFEPDSVADTTSVLTLTLDATVVLGTYTLVVRGNAPDQDEETVEITLVVAAASGVKGSNQALGRVRGGGPALASRGGQGTR